MPRRSISRLGLKIGAAFLLGICMTRPINAAGIALLDSSESCRLYTYDDRTGKRVEAGQKVTGRLTAGWGHTGPDVKAGMEVTQQIADTWRLLDRKRTADFVERAVTRPMTDNQFAALVDFAFNAGVGAFQRTLAPKVNTGDWSGVIAELRLWVTSGGRVMPGLKIRRAREIALILTPDTAALPPGASAVLTGAAPDRPGLWRRFCSWFHSV